MNTDQLAEYADNEAYKLSVLLDEVRTIITDEDYNFNHRSQVSEFIRRIRSHRQSLERFKERITTN